MIFMVGFKSIFINLIQVHLFDIDIPGKITFKESTNLSPGNQFTTFDTREFLEVFLKFRIKAS